MMQSPNFFGVIEAIGSASEKIKKKGGLLIGRDRAAQHGAHKTPRRARRRHYSRRGTGLGNYLNFGGPYLGFMACKSAYVRQMPGRIIGEAKDAKRKQTFLHDARHTRAAHTPRKGHIEHLHKPGAYRA